jgi:oligogalacturonide transport system substrate-binding protein
METYPWITVESQYGAWTDWEANMATAFATGTAPDVNQINWNWITSFSADGSIYKDLNEYSDTIKLDGFAQSALEQCTLAGELQAIPVSMTGRIFYWNKSTFENAGIATPTTLAELYAAGETFKTVLGDDYYPIALGEYDRMILMVYYLESVYGKAWVVDNTLQYTAEEIQVGLEFIQSLEDKHVTPSIETILGDGAESLDKNPKWMEGKYAGIFEWDSSASKFQGALAEGQEFVVGEYLADMGEFKGGYSKVSLAFAISETTPYPEECALLINFLLNETAGVEIMAAERGIPLSQTALTICKDKGLLNATVAEANGKILSWVTYPLDPKFEAAELKSTDGVYYDAMAGLSYGDYSLEDAAQVLIDGINGVLAN